MPPIPPPDPTNKMLPDQKTQNSSGVWRWSVIAQKWKLLDNVQIGRTHPTKGRTVEELIVREKENFTPG